MKETIKTIMEWHEETFPGATLTGQIKKFLEEAREYNQNPSVDELVDMYIVACGVARFNSLMAMKYFGLVKRLQKNTRGAGVKNFHSAVYKKMKKNRNRVWGKSGDGVYHHQLGIED